MLVCRSYCRLLEGKSLAVDPKSPARTVCLQNPKKRVVPA